MATLEMIWEDRAEVHEVADEGAGVFLVVDDRGVMTFGGQFIASELPPYSALVPALRNLGVSQGLDVARLNGSVLWSMAAELAKEAKETEAKEKANGGL